MKAAGRTLTVGELREALAGLDDNDTVELLVDDEFEPWTQEPTEVTVAGSVVTLT